MIPAQTGEEDEKASRCKPAIGLLEWFRPGEYERVEHVLEDCRRLGVRHLRTGISWADWWQSGGEGWYDWLLPRLAQDVELLPCCVYTPPSLGLQPKTSSPPREPKQYADWLDVLITRHGEHFEWVELWNEPNNLREWDVTLDPEWQCFSEMVGGAAYWARHRGKRTVLGGISPVDPHWLRLMCERGVMQYIDAVGIHGFPATYEFHWDGWDAQLRQAREVLAACGHSPQIWVTETGYSTVRHDERQQLRHFLEALDAPAERLYWYAVQDLHPDLPTVDGFHSDEREYHFGLKRADGTPKLLYRLWAEEGLAGVQSAEWMTHPVTAAVASTDERPALLTGGAGFVGTNLAERLLSEGRRVLIYDNLSRPGVERNLRGLRERHGDRVEVEVADVRDFHTLRQCVARAGEVYHFAAQVAVTTSLVAPVHDFEVNARGTLNLLEAIRACEEPPSLVFTSTNKVYGGLDDVGLRLYGQRYEPEDPLLRSRGISEARCLDFHSPYGCSKGTADQYVIDYARTFGLPAVVFRMSCIYGPHQFGTEDQGWVAHFLIQALRGQPITLYGDGKQVRDVLFVGDLVEALLQAQRRMATLSGQAFNIGGGPENTVSLLELLALMRALSGREPEVQFGDWRPGDQRYYVSDTTKFTEATGWAPRTSVAQGVGRLWHWLQVAGVVPGIPLMPAQNGAVTEVVNVNQLEELEGEEVLTR